jgi:uncharacterized membrane protein YdjX (TVP38/TMEM64 family)
MPDARDHDSSQKPSRILFHLGSLEVTPKRLVSTLIGATLIVGIGFLWQQIGLEELHARAEALPAVGVIAAISLLPLVGFPVSWLHLIAGVRFGFLGGMTVVALTGVLHHLFGWAFVRILPEQFFRWSNSWSEKLRGAGHRDATMLCGLLPGVPYTAQLYLLPAIGVPLHLLLGLSSALHTARAVVTILLGDFSDNLTPARIATLAAYFVILFTASALTLRGLRRNLARDGSDRASRSTSGS